MSMVMAVGSVQSKFNVKNGNLTVIVDVIMMVNITKSRGKLCKDNASLPPFSIDDYLYGLPAAGYRNGTSLNNEGSNGNYWSATLNESNPNNAYNLNFNSGNHNTNWNNRNYGQSVRPVSELTMEKGTMNEHHRFFISPELLLRDLFVAYKDARKHKRGRKYQLEFEFNLEENLVLLRDELIMGRYKPRSSACFIIHEPKMREIFAADFRDRIVHHLFYNYTHVLFERTFIFDSYSCIKGRGTHLGIERLRHHIRSVSAGYSKPCYILKLDIKGYFMNIDRMRLLSICRNTFCRMKRRMSNKPGLMWNEILDFDFVDYLLETIICSDPVENCIVQGSSVEWNKLPYDKSLFTAEKGCGLPIGNLSSQLFSNVYLNLFDQFVKRVLGCKHYGRYVDDAYIVSDSCERLKSMIPKIDGFLKENLGLSLHPDKVRIYDAYQGIAFLGAYLKPFRSYVSSATLRRIKLNMRMYRFFSVKRLASALNSSLGVMSHYDSFCLRRVLLGKQAWLKNIGAFCKDWLVFVPHIKMRAVDFYDLIGSE